MKNIGLLISSMNGGGAERVVSHLSGILGVDYNMYVILFENTYAEYECRGTVCNLDVPAVSGSPIVKIGLLKKRIAKLKELIKKEKLECVISFLDSPNFVNLFAKVDGCRKIISIRNYSDLENKQSLLGRLTDVAMKNLYKRSDCVVTVSKLIENNFKKHYGIPSDKIFTIYNPYDFDAMNAKCGEALSDDELNFYKDHFIYCSVGRIMYQKGFWHLLKAFKEVNDKNPETRLAIIGEDISQGKITALINEMGLGDKVLLTGRVKNPYKYMVNSDVYVLSSLFEGFPNAMVEAMACGCPIIAADCKSGPREILFEKSNLESSLSEITDADYGVLIPELESEENWDKNVLTDGEKNLCFAMEEMYVNKQKRQYYSEQAKKRSRDFDFERCRESFSKVIEES